MAGARPDYSSVTVAASQERNSMKAPATELCGGMGVGDAIAYADDDFKL